MSWPRQGSQNSLDNPEFERKSWISWVWGFEVVHAKGSLEVALPPNASLVLRGTPTFIHEIHGRSFLLWLFVGLVYADSNL